MKRLFIAINLPQNIKEAIEEIINNLPILPKENWHLTISFLGYQPDEKIPNILESVKITTQSLVSLKRPILVEFEKIILAPANRPARMIWLVGSKETSKILGAIKTKLEDELVKNGVRFQRDNREYNTHLTLARFSPTQINAAIKQIDTDIISVNQRIHQRKSALSFQAQSLDLMESYLKRTGAEYEILTRVDFIQEIY